MTVLYLVCIIRLRRCAKCIRRISYDHLIFHSFSCLLQFFLFEFGFFILIYFLLFLSLCAYYDLVLSVLAIISFGCSNLVDASTDFTSGVFVESRHISIVFSIVIFRAISGIPSPRNFRVIAWNQTLLHRYMPCVTYYV